MQMPNVPDQSEAVQWIAAAAAASDENI